MTPKRFKAWRKEMGFSDAKAAEALGVLKPTIETMSAASEGIRVFLLSSQGRLPALFRPADKPR